MKGQYVSDLSEGRPVDGLFAVRSKELRSARTGTAYLALELADRTGRIPAVLFRPDVAAQRVPVGSVVRARGSVTTYRGRRRISLEAIRSVAEYDRGDMIASGTRDGRELWTRFETLVGSVRDRRLRDVVSSVFAEQGVSERFRDCPAAQNHHHAYAGGLLEHTVGVAETCLRVCDSYEQADRDLLLAAALLHDVGKIDELSYDTCVSYTDEGRLIGHVVLGERRVSRAVEDSGEVPRDVATRLSHVLLSHHGELEWGSPKRPAMLEALILHHVDNLDAKVAGFVELVSGAALIEERWTDVTNLFRRPLYVPRATEDDRGWDPAEDDEYVARGA